VSQHEDQVLEATTETLVISFERDKFEKILSQGDNSSLSVRKHKNITLAK